MLPNLILLSLTFNAKNLKIVSLQRIFVTTFRDVLRAYRLNVYGVL